MPKAAKRETRWLGGPLVFVGESPDESTTSHSPNPKPERYAPLEGENITDHEHEVSVSSDAV
jgi:hypothetical protein